MAQANQHGGAVTRRILETMARHPNGTTAMCVSLSLAHSLKSVKSTIRRLVHEGLVARVGIQRSGTRHGGNPVIYRVARPDEIAKLRDLVVARSAKMSPRDCDLAMIETDKAAARFAKLMGPIRYEDFPPRAEGRLVGGSSGGLFSATGCAALMCLM